MTVAMDHHYDFCVGPDHVEEPATCVCKTFTDSDTLQMTLAYPGPLSNNKADGLYIYVKVLDSDPFRVVGAKMKDRKHLS